jgi:hypothetical protein
MFQKSPGEMLDRRICHNWFEVRWIWMKISVVKTKMLPVVIVMVPRAEISPNNEISHYPADEQTL